MLSISTTLSAMTNGSRNAKGSGGQALYDAQKRTAKIYLFVYSPPNNSDPANYMKAAYGLNVFRYNSLHF